MQKIMVILFAIIMLSGECVFAQFDILEKVQKKVEKKIEKNTDDAIDNGLNKAEDEAKGKNKEKNSEEKVTEESVETGEVSGTAPIEKKELKLYSKFDFVPGNEIIFYDDFKSDRIGDFPQKWNTNGSGEVVETDGNQSRWFRLTNAVTYMPYMDIDSFGENFTVEIDFLYDVPEKANYGGLYIDFYKSDNLEEVPSASSGPYYPGFQFELHAAKNSSARIVGKPVYPNGNSIDVGGANSTETSSFRINEINRLSIAFNKQRVRAYLNEKKALDLPRVLKPAQTMNKMDIRTWYWNGSENDNILIKEIRIAKGEQDTRNQLLTEGKFVTHGILFDINSDKIKPESYGTLKEIASALSENPSAKVKIIGHTDSDGNDESNLDLSKRRSISVKNALVSEFGIPDAQLETDGKGEIEPVSSNDSPEGKANNRRVEFVKL